MNTIQLQPVDELSISTVPVAPLVKRPSDPTVRIRSARDVFHRLMYVTAPLFVKSFSMRRPTSPLNDSLLSVSSEVAVVV